MENIFERGFFLPKDKNNMQSILNLSSVYNSVEELLPYTLLRTNVLTSDGGVDTFVLTTSAHSEDKIIYTSEADLINLQIRDGGYF